MTLLVFNNWSLVISLKIAGWVADGVDPDQMSHFVAWWVTLCSELSVCLNTHGKYNWLYVKIVSEMRNHDWNKIRKYQLWSRKRVQIGWLGWLENKASDFVNDCLAVWYLVNNMELEAKSDGC